MHILAREEPTTPVDAQAFPGDAIHHHQNASKWFGLSGSEASAGNSQFRPRRQIIPPTAWSLAALLRDFLVVLQESGKADVRHGCFTMLSKTE
jgi:hypothetical protein